MLSAEIRRRFLDYFAKRQHAVIESSSLIPVNDPTLLFTNAGMVQFKDVFLGLDKRPYDRAVSAQRCVRAGGKHNDLDNVGYTARHHTFFEMLGNFSFGGYFKQEAIRYAWDFLTKDLGLPVEKLWVTVYQEDEEAEQLWLRDIGVPAERLARLGQQSNFWAMGDTGPCGPCTEIFYDHGPEVAGGPPGSPDEDGDRYVEIWNLVFMQYNRDSEGKLTPLPKPSVDTGMGLERIAAVMQGVHNNYDTDIFQHLIKAVQTLVAKPVDEHGLKAMRVIADHIRSTSFLIADGVTPSNEGRGYVLRRIIRRALRHGHHLGLTEPFFYRLVAPLGEVMGDAYPALITQQRLISDLIKREEEQFARTLTHGLKLFEQWVRQHQGQVVIPGDVVFKLYDTYGFPLDLTRDLAREQAMSVDEMGFEQAMAEQRARAKASHSFTSELTQHLTVTEATLFTGYHAIAGQTEIVDLLKEGQRVSQLKAGDEGAIILQQTPFYAESGGQVGDRGWIEAIDQRFEVRDTKALGAAVVHYGKVVSGNFTQHQPVRAVVDEKRRSATALNHSATHLLHAALRRILGEHVVQKGSLVAPERLRFDFAHSSPLTQAEREAIEHCVNEHIRANELVDTKIMSREEALQSGAMALFGENYGDQVRVLSMGEFSRELCGGTHVARTGDIGMFKIIEEAGIAAGVRRIEALTGPAALTWLQQQLSQLQTSAQLLKTEPEQLSSKITQLQERARQLEKEQAVWKSKLSANIGQELASQALDIQGVKVLTTTLEHADMDMLRETVEQLKNKLQHAIVVLAATTADKVSLVVGVTKNLTSQVSAAELARYLAEQVGGKGGGRPDMAQAGGNQADALPKALQSVTTWLKSKLAKAL